MTLILIVSLQDYLTVFCQPQQDESASLPESALLLSRYIQIPSVSGQEKEAGEFLAAQCKEKGLYIEVFNSHTGGYNLAASLFPLSSGKPNILLLNHIDVVPAGHDSSWQHRPYSGAIRRDTLWGRGTLDMKGVAVMQLMAIAKKNTRVL